MNVIRAWKLVELSLEMADKDTFDINYDRKEEFRNVFMKISSWIWFSLHLERRNGELHHDNVGTNMEQMVESLAMTFFGRKKSTSVEIENGLFLKRNLKKIKTLERTTPWYNWRNSMRLAEYTSLLKQA